MARKYPVYKHLNLPEVDKQVQEAWQAERTFAKSLQERPADRPFVFYEGPPSANGQPGIHHVMARTIKDVFCRFKTLEGYRVERKAGWDTHGLPVELGVEKELGITKEDIGQKISVAEYNEACRKAVMRYTDRWNALTQLMGYWVDMDDPYITYQPQYMETVWWLLKQLWEQDLIYKGYTIQPYSPKAGTGLSSHELNMPGCYRDVKDTSVVAQFPLQIDERARQVLGENLLTECPTYFIAWTTTPWTLPSNTALTVGPKIAYVLVRTVNPYTHKPQQVILARDLLPRYFKPERQNVPLAEYKQNGQNLPWSIEWEGTGRELAELRYEQLLPYAQPYQNPENAFRVILGDFVTTEDGTGVVHTAPTFGADDAQVAKQANPEVPPLLVLDEDENPVPLVDLQGRFRPEMGPYAGQYVKNEYYPEGEAPQKSVDVQIAIQLKEENKAFKVEKYGHSYPHCWRTDKPVLYYPLNSWFVKVTARKERLVALNQEINWKPASTGEGRFGNWLENANDWNLSRSRYWGIPLPIWSTEDGKERRIFGSVAELKAACDEALARGFMKEHPLQEFQPGNLAEENYATVDLHRHVVDEIVLVSDSGQPMHREADLIDVWFDSGSMPYAQNHYPFAQEGHSQQPPAFPADFIAEGVDQTRGWFYTLHAIAGLVFDQPAYRNVVSNGLVLDKNGNKMSKRLGNAIDPFETIEKYGADAVRWYMISNAQPWDNLKFDLKGVEEVRRRFFGTLHNTYAFYALYANIDAFVPSGAGAPLADRPELDRWVLSRLEVLQQQVRAFLDDYEPTRAARAIMYFVDEELSNWYVRLNRRRFWKGELNADKRMAYETLHTCLLTLSQLMSPIAPFYADRLYRDLTAPLPAKNRYESVHLSYWPEARPERIDERLNERMAAARQLTSMVLSLRKRENIKVRQPLQKILVPALSDHDAKLVESVRELLLAETNVKELEIIREVAGVITKRIKPNFKVLGPRFGKEMKAVATAVKALDQDAINALEEKGHLELSINGRLETLQADEVEITTDDIPGMLVLSQNGFTVALDITLTESLRQEGLVRELVNRLQNLRKDQGLAVTDRISLHLEENPALKDAVQAQETYLKTEVLASGMQWHPHLQEGSTLDIEGHSTRVQIVKLT